VKSSDGPFSVFKDREAHKQVIAALTNKGYRPTICPNLGDLRIYQCPTTLISPESIYMLELIFLTTQNDVLPYAGGWADQPPWFAEAYTLYKHELNIHQKLA
jgi:hypothetical protein